MSVTSAISFLDPLIGNPPPWYGHLSIADYPPALGVAYLRLKQKLLR